MFKRMSEISLLVPKLSLEEHVIFREDVRPSGAFLEQPDSHAVFSIGKMEELLEIGSEAQRSVILLEIPHLIEHCVEETMERIVPRLCAAVHKWSVQLQISAAEALRDVAQYRLSQARAKQVCTAAFRVVNASTTEEVFEAWGEILVAALPYVDWLPEELNRVIALLDGHCAAKSDISRKLTARVLGPLSLCIKPEEVESKLLHRAVALCQDENPEVRGMISESLAFIGAAVSIDVVENDIWPSILNLLSDRDERIHAASLRSIAHIVQTHRIKYEEDAIKQRKLFTHLLPPVFFRECDFSYKAATEDQRGINQSTYLLLEMIAEVYGELVYSVYRSSLDPCPKRNAFKAFVAMATCNGPIVRRHCAFNFPGVALSFHSRYAFRLSTIAEFLSRDTDPETRWILAAGIHEVARTLSEGEIAVSNIYKAVMTLLRDINPLVRMSVLRNFNLILKEITKHNSYATAGKLTPLCHSLTLLSTGTWRMQKLLAQQLELCSDFVPPHVIKAIIMPVLYQMAEESSHMVRKASMAGIVQCLRNISDPVEREEVMTSFDIKWGQGIVYWMRIAYIDAGAAAANRFSKLLFRDLFAAKILRLVNDPVGNVRLRLAGVLDKLAPACQQMEDFYNAMSALKNDEDTDIRGRMEIMERKIEAAIEYDKRNGEEDLERERHERDLYEKCLQLKLKKNMTKKSPSAKERIAEGYVEAQETVAPNEQPANDESTKVKSPLKSQLTNLVKGLKSDEESPRAIEDLKQDKDDVALITDNEDAELIGAQETSATSPLSRRIKTWLLSPRRLRNKSDREEFA